MDSSSSKGRSQPGSALSRAVPLYIAFVVLLALALAVLGWHSRPLGADWLALVVLCIMGVLGSSSQENNVGAKIGFSFASIILLASVAILGPCGAAIVGAVTHLLVFNKYTVRVRLFNMGMTAAIGAVGGFAYLMSGGMMPVSTAAGAWPLLSRVGFPLMVADVVLCLANAVVLSGVVYLSNRVPPRRFIAGMLGTSGLAYIGYGIIGFLFVVLWIPAGVGPFSAVLILAPLFVARWAFVQYGDEQRAHERTLSALVTAVETKDVYTRGHSERVAQLCDLMAVAMSLGHHDAASLRYAGMLHDIGKLSIPMRVLRTSDPPTDHDLANLALHPVRGLEMIREIDFLKDSFPGVLHHHERYDGRGYPVGLRGEDIPLFARVIAVADAFDSLTTARAHRDAYSVEGALTELRARAGTQFDPNVVAALERALARHTWQPTTLEPRVLATAGRAYDHDDPASSDQMADRSARASAGGEGSVPLPGRGTR